MSPYMTQYTLYLPYKGILNLGRAAAIERNLGVSHSKVALEIIVLVEGLPGALYFTCRSALQVLGFRAS